MEARDRTRFSGARVYNDADFVHNSTGNWVTVTFNSEYYDTDAYHSTAIATSRLVVPKDGFYLVGAHMTFDNSTAGTRRGIRIVNQAGAVLGIWVSYFTLANFDGYLFMTTLTNRLAGEYLIVETFQDSGGNLNVLRAANFSPEFWICKVS
jgi:hypothetical protein